MQWDNAKVHVNQLPSEWTTVVGSYEKSRPKNIKIDNHGKYKRIQVVLKPIEDFETQLIVYKDKDGSTKDAWYAIFNQDEGIIYKRTIK